MGHITYLLSFLVRGEILGFRPTILFMSKLRKQFYDSKRWKEVAMMVREMKHYSCERCGEYATQVHHIVHLNDENVRDPNVSINIDNLILLCDKCHAIEHNSKKVSFDEDGNPLESPL